VPSNIEGSVIQEEATTLRHGGLMLSNGAATAYVIVDNLELKNWFNHGIGTPSGMNGDIYHHLTVRNVTIKDVDNAGVNLSSWLERPSNGRKGLRGGDHLTFTTTSSTAPTPSALPVTSPRPRLKTTRSRTSR
jgi:hypothetical protein